ncbi:MAG: hypothetical protein ABIP81_05465, partial [Terriglobales bacterium]
MKSALRALLVSSLLLLGLPALAQDPDPQFVALYKSKCAACHGVDGKATAIGKKMNTRDFQT